MRKANAMMEQRQVQQFACRRIVAHGKVSGVVEHGAEPEGRGRSSVVLASDHPVRDGSPRFGPREEPRGTGSALALLRPHWSDTATDCSDDGGVDEATAQVMPVYVD